MNVIQRNNKYPRTTFQRVGIGQLFSLSTNGTPLVKVDNRRWGVLAPRFDIPGVTGVQKPSGVPVPYYAPAVTGIDGPTEVFDPNSNPLVLGGGSVNGDATVIETDPQFYLGQSSFLLSAVFNSNNTVSLSWTYPNLKAGFGGATVTATRILVQRSTSTRQTPYGPTGDGPANSWVNTSKYADIIADLAWTTLYNETVNYVVTGAPPYPLTASIPDDSPPISSSSHIFHYRLIVFLTVTVGPVHLFYEVDWNVITIVTPYQITSVTGNPALVSWEVPSNSEMQSLSRLFANSLSAVRGNITYALTSSQITMPAADDSTMSLAINLNTSNSFIVNDGEHWVIDGVGTVRIYKVPASSNAITIKNPGYSTNVAPTTVVSSGKAIKNTTNLRWSFDLTTQPMYYTFQKGYDGTTWPVSFPLDANFSQPFRDAEPPNPTIYYRILAHMPANSEGILYEYDLYYTQRSVT